METPDPASVPPHPIEHPQRAGMDRQHGPADGQGHPVSVDRRRVEAMREDCRAGTDIRLGADRHGRRLVAGDKVAAAGVVLSKRSLAAVRRKVGAGIGARAARIGSDCSVNARPTAAAVRCCVDHSRLVNGGDARSQGRGDGWGTVVTTSGAGTAGTRRQKGGDDQGHSEGEPRPWACSQRPLGTTIQPVTTMEPVSLRSTDRAQTHPEGEPQARIGSSQSHRNPPSPCCGVCVVQTRPLPILVSSGRRGHLTAPQHPADSTGDVGDGSRWGRKSVGDRSGPYSERHPIDSCSGAERLKAPRHSGMRSKYRIGPLPAFGCGAGRGREAIRIGPAWGPFVDGGSGPERRFATPVTRRGSRTVPSARGRRGRGSARYRRCGSGR